MRRLISLVLLQAFLLSSLPVEPLLADSSHAHLRPRAAVTRSLPELDSLAADGGERFETLREVPRGKIGVLFPSYSSLTQELPDRAQALYDAYKDVREIYEVASARSGYSVPALFLKERANDQTVTVLAATLYSIALYRALEGRVGDPFKPGFVAGDSSGIFAAAVITGSVRLGDMVDFIVKASRHMEEMAKQIDYGVLVVPKASYGDIETLMEPGKIELLKDSPRRLTLAVRAGVDVQTLKEEIAKRTGQNARYQYPPLAKGPHTSFYKDGREDVVRWVESLDIKDPGTPIITSSLKDGTLTDAAGVKEELTEGFFRPVYWSDVVRRLKENGVGLFLEMGSGEQLAKLNQKLAPEAVTVSVNSAPLVQSIADAMRITDAVDETVLDGGEKRIEESLEGLRDRLQALREHEGLSLRKAEEKIGVHADSSAWSRWEKGLSVPSIQNLPKIAEAFGISVTFLLTGDTRPVFQVDKSSFPERLKKLREARGRSLRDVAREATVDNSELSRLERGEDRPKIQTLLALSEALDVEPGYLLLGEATLYLPTYYTEQYGGFDLSAYGDVVFPLASELFKETGRLKKALELILEYGLDWSIRDLSHYFSRVAPKALYESRGNLNLLRQFLKKSTAQDGGGRSFSKDFTLQAEGQTLDLLKIALEGKAPVRQMKRWTALLRQRDQIPAVAVPDGFLNYLEINDQYGIGYPRLKRLQEGGVIHPQTSEQAGRGEKSGHAGYYVSSQEVDRIVNLVSTEEARRRLGTNALMIHHLVEQGVLQQDREVHEATGAKSIAVEPLNRLIEKEAVIVPLSQIVSTLHERYGIKQHTLYHYLKDVGEILGRERALKVFGKTDLTAPMFRTFKVGDVEMFLGIHLTDLLKLTKELNRLQHILKTWVPVETLMSQLEGKGITSWDLHSRIQSGLLEGVTVRPTLNIVPPEKMNTTYLSPESTRKVRQLFEETISDRQTDLSKVRPEGQWNTGEVVSLWRTLPREKREAFLFLLKWYQGEELTRSLVNAYVETEEPALVTLLQQVDTAPLYRMVAKSAQKTTPTSQPSTIHHLVRLVTVLGEIKEAKSLTLLKTLLDHPAPKIRSVAQESITHLTTPQIQVPPGYIPTVGSGLYHRQLGVGRVIASSGQGEHLLVEIQFEKGGTKRFLWEIVRRFVLLNAPEEAGDGGQRIRPLTTLSPSVLVPFQSP